MIKLKGVKELQEALNPERFKKIVTRTLNKIGPQVKTAISREVRNTYNIKKERLDAGLYVKLANWEDPSFLLRYKGRPPGLQHFDARQTRKGVTVKVKNEGGRKVVKGAFIPNKITGVYKRVSEERLPIKRLYGPDIPAMVNTVGLEAAQQTVNTKVDKIFTHEFEYELSRK